MTAGCWCGNADLSPWHGSYARCPACETLVDVSASIPAGSAAYDESYWLGKMAALYKDMGCDSIDDIVLLHYRERAAHWAGRVVRHVAPGARVLEMGCGLGTLTRWLLDLGYQAVATELDPAWRDYVRRKLGIPVLDPAEALAKAGVLRPVGSKEAGVPRPVGPEKANGLHPVGPEHTGVLRPSGLEKANGFHSDPPEQENASPYDAIIAMDVLEHLADPLDELRDISTALHAGGTLILQLPEYPAGASHADLAGAGHPFLNMLLPGEHCFLYSRQALARLLGRFGFTHLDWQAGLFPSDMFVCASRKPLAVCSPEQAEARLMALPHAISAYAALKNAVTLAETWQTYGRRLQELEALVQGEQAEENSDATPDGAKAGGGRDAGNSKHSGPTGAEGDANGDRDGNAGSNRVNNATSVCAAGLMSGGAAGSRAGGPAGGATPDAGPTVYDASGPSPSGGACAFAAVSSVFPHPENVERLLYVNLESANGAGPDAGSASAQLPGAKRLEHLFARFPKAEITVACEASAVSLYERMSNVGRVIPLHLKTLGQTAYVRQAARLLRACRPEAVVMDGSESPEAIRALLHEAGCVHLHSDSGKT